MNPFYKKLVLWLVIGLVLVTIFEVLKKTPRSRELISYSEFVSMVEKGVIVRVTIQDEQICGVAETGPFETVAPTDPKLIRLLKRHGVEITAKPEEKSLLLRLVFSWFPVLLLLAAWILFMRRMQAGSGKLLSFGKTRAKLVGDSGEKATFDDVAGVDEAKEELREVVEFLSEPEKFIRLGGRIPKGVLLVGAPGTGKTLLARAIAGEAHVPFFSISGSDFVEMFGGVGASRVRDLFVRGQKNAPCIIFIDELDAVGRQRGAGIGPGHNEREQTLNQLLVEMDGFESNEGVILIAATNRPDVLDPALLRPGRFDRQVAVPVPDLKGREAIFEVQLKKKVVADSLDVHLLARGTSGLTGADIENIVNEAALIAANRGKEKVGMVDMEDAKDKVLMGPERKSIVISEEEKRMTAYHESGHTLVAKLTPNTDAIEKVTIIPRGRRLGLTQQVPLDERQFYPKKYLLAKIAVLLGGKAAEEIVLDLQTTAAEKDIETASELARKMVCDYGMSEALGPLTFGKGEEEIFLGKEIARHRDYSELTAQKIDEEIGNIVNGAYEMTYQLIKDNLACLHSIAQGLLERETLDSDDIDRIMVTKAQSG